MDAARTAWRLGADVTILYRRTRPEMPANDEDIEGALEEGIKIEFLTLPVEVISENGKLTKIKCTRMALGKFDGTGRRRPIPQKESEFELDVDTLIPAIGQKPNLDFLSGNSGMNVTKWNTLEVDQDTLVTNVDGIFAGGDVVTGPSTVLAAMKAGKSAAESIHRYLRGESLEKEYKPTKPRMEVPPVEISIDEAMSLERPKIPCLAVSKRAGNFQEVELGFSEEQAVSEAKRCLRCDLESKGGK